MISFSRLGHHGRLGNQLFQYAFLRSHARRLSVPFHCPEWIGDSIFHLGDEAERAPFPEGVRHLYVEPVHRTGFNLTSLEVADGTDVLGYFQTARYFDGEAVRRWFSFREERVAAVRSRFRHLDFSSSAGLHLRFGDFMTTGREDFYTPRRRYYRQALGLLARKAARAYLGSLGASCQFVEGNEPYEDLYLQTLCRDFICAPSTFSWWGAWLNAHPDKVIVVPSEGPFRPGSPFQNTAFWPDDWIRLQALGGILDHRHSVILAKWVEKRLSKLGRRFARLLP